MAAGPNPARKTHLYARLNMPGDNKVDRRGIAHVDARTKLGRLHKAFKKALLDHFDGQPNIIERGIIERCCFLQLKCHLLDRKMAEQGDLTEMDSHCYIAWSNALQRSLLRLRIRDIHELDHLRATTNYTRSLR